MKQKIKTFIIIFIVPIITGVITSKIENINFFQAIELIIKTLIDWSKTILLYKIPVWIILIILLLIFLILKVIIWIYNKKEKIKLIEEDVKKVYKDYTTDCYNDINYKWIWKERYDGIEMNYLHPICTCGCDLINTYNSYIKCPDCKKSYKNTINLEEAERVFLNRYRKRLEAYKNKRSNQ